MCVFALFLGCMYILQPNPVHEKYDLRRQLLPYKQYAMQRLKTGEHDGHGVIRGTIREKKT